jgi:hypothetical protein
MLPLGRGHVYFVASSVDHLVGLIVIVPSESMVLGPLWVAFWDASVLLVEVQEGFVASEPWTDHPMASKTHRGPFSLVCYCPDCRPS